MDRNLLGRDGHQRFVPELEKMEGRGQGPFSCIVRGHRSYNLEADLDHAKSYLQILTSTFKIVSYDGYLAVTNNARAHKSSEACKFVFTFGNRVSSSPRCAYSGWSLVSPKEQIRQIRMKDIQINTAWSIYDSRRSGNQLTTTSRLNIELSGGRSSF